MGTKVVGMAGDKSGASGDQGGQQRQYDPVPPVVAEGAPRRRSQQSQRQQKPAAQDGCIAVKEKGAIPPQDRVHALSS
jgi:hypothetical protein